MAEVLPDLVDECFFIAPIGADGSETRERSDGVMAYIVAPAAEALGLVTIRADIIAKPGQITRQVIEHVVGARAAVVDLTGANPNVYYEMAVRHTAQLPTVLIAQQGEVLPFDISQMRTIFFDHTNLKSAAQCREQIERHLREALAGEVDSPIAASVSVQRLEQGSAQERVLAQLVDGLDEIRNSLQRLEIGARPNSVADEGSRLASSTAVHLGDASSAAAPVPERTGFPLVARVENPDTAGVDEAISRAFDRLGGSPAAEETEPSSDNAPDAGES